MNEPCNHHWTVTSPCPFCQMKTIACLRRVIKEHNDGLQESCDAQNATGHCEAYRSRGKSCADCPRQWVIHVH